MAIATFTNHRTCFTKKPPLQSYKRRRVACQHFPYDQTLRLQAGAGEDDIYLPSGLDRVDSERQEEEEEEEEDGDSCLGVVSLWLTQGLVVGTLMFPGKNTIQSVCLPVLLCPG